MKFLICNVYMDGEYKKVGYNINEISSIISEKNSSTTNTMIFFNDKSVARIKESFSQIVKQINA